MKWKECLLFIKRDPFLRKECVDLFTVIYTWNKFWFFVVGIQKLHHRLKRFWGKWYTYNVSSTYLVCFNEFDDFFSILAFLYGNVLAEKQIKQGGHVFTDYLQCRSFEVSVYWSTVKGWSTISFQQIFICSRSTTKTLEKIMKYVQSY